MTWVGLVLVVVTGAVAWAFRAVHAGTLTMWLGVGVPYLLLASLGLVQLVRRGRLSPLLGYRRGDPSVGILVGLGLLCGTWLFARQWLHAGLSQRAWLFSVYLLAGDPGRTSNSLFLLLLVLCEEIVWRGWVQLELREQLGPRRAWMVCAFLYGAAQLPTLFTLEDAVAGKNPLLVLAALGCGLCWSFLSERTGRLLPGLLAHVVFSYFASRSFWLFA